MVSLTRSSSAPAGSAGTGGAGCAGGGGCGGAGCGGRVSRGGCRGSSGRRGGKGCRGSSGRRGGKGRRRPSGCRDGSGALVDVEVPLDARPRADPGNSVRFLGGMARVSHADRSARWLRARLLADQAPTADGDGHDGTQDVFVEAFRRTEDEIDYARRVVENDGSARVHRRGESADSDSRGKGTLKESRKVSAFQSSFIDACLDGPRWMASALDTSMAVLRVLGGLYLPMHHGRKESKRPRVGRAQRSG